MPAAIDRLYEAFRDVEKPCDVRGCDCSVCISTEGIRQLLDADQRTLTHDDLIPYVANVLGTVGAPADFAYLLPAILRVWREELQKYESAFNERLHPALRMNNFLYGHLSECHREAVLAFMRNALLDRIGRETSLAILPWGSPCCPSPDKMEKMLDHFAEVSQIMAAMEKGPEAAEAALKEFLPRELDMIRSLEAEVVRSEEEYGAASPTYGWFRHVGSYGVLARDMERLWSRWWDMPNQGCAVAVIQYSSCLVCDYKHNPVFPPPVGGQGGGAPCLWSYMGYDDGESWQMENAAFLSATLSVTYLREKLTQAMGKLSTPDLRSRTATILGILEQNPSQVEERISQLIRMVS